MKREGITVYESALFRTVTTVIEGDDYVLLVDPNWLPQEVEFIAQHVERVSGGRSLFLLFTHSDYDHIIGYGRFKTATTIASLAFTQNKQPEQILQQIRNFDDGYYLKRSYPIVYPDIDLIIAGDGVSQPIGNEELRFFQAPGHNPDGLLAFLPQRGVLIVGDYLSNIEFPYVYHSVKKYRKTLDTIKLLVEGGEVELLISGHGDATDDSAEMQHRLEESYTYLDQLEHSVRTDTPFDLPTLFTRYDFPKVMGKFHAGNVKLMKEHVAKYPA